MREVKRLYRDSGIGPGCKVRRYGGTVIGTVIETYPHFPGVTVQFGSKLYAIGPEELELVATKAEAIASGWATEEDVK